MSSECATCHAPFDFTADDRRFLDKLAPVFGTVRIDIPDPKHCAPCRQRRRLAFRNERALYKRQCGLCSKSILAAVCPDRPHQVYCNECWWGDGWDANSFGRRYDMSRGFFEQFGELLSEVPFPALSNSNTENSDYVNQTANLKDCYLLFNCANSQECYYGNRVNDSVNCVDCSIVDHSELAYECCTSSHLYNSVFCQDCANCSDCAFLYDCIGCKQCLLSFNLRNQEYCIENRPYSRQEYEQRAAEIRSQMASAQGFTALQGKFSKMLTEQAWHRAARIRSAENSCGDYLSNCRNAYSCFQCSGIEDSRYTMFADHSKDIMDCDNCYEGELSYECDGIGLGTYRLLFSRNIWPGSTDVIYSNACPNSKYIFGCTGLKRGEYCILNLQYSRDEYEQLVPQIVERMTAQGEWGEYFPPALSAFGYNESIAADYYPLSQDEAQKLGFSWSAYEPAHSPGLSEVSAAALPDTITEISDGIVSQVIVPDGGKPFRITTAELEFYRRLGITLPRKSFEQRYKSRLGRMNPRRLYAGCCAKCDAAVRTSIASHRLEKIICEQCYNAMFK